MALNSTNSSTKIACVIVPHFAVAVERRENDSLVGNPVVIGGMPCEEGRVYDLSEEAAMSGVQKGVPLRQAEELCPEAIFITADEDKYMQAFRQLLEVLESFTPEVEPNGLGCVYLGVNGLEYFHGDDTQLCRSIGLAVRERTRLESALGLAGNKFAAYVAASFAGLNRALIVEPGRERMFLQDFPIDFLPMSEEMRQRLLLLGVRTMGDFASLPAAAVFRQFGQEGQRLHLLACGRDGRKVIPCRGDVPFEADRDFDDPIQSLEILTEAARQLAASLLAQLHGRFQMCQKVRVSIQLEDGGVQEEGLAFNEPSSNREKMELNISQLLGRFNYRCGVTGLKVSLEGICPESGTQLDLLVGQSGQAWKLDRAIRHLISKYGPARFYRALPLDRRARLPERRFTLVGYAPQDDQALAAGSGN